MIEKKSISLGNPFSPGGSVYVARSTDDLLSMAVDFEYLRLHEENIIVTTRLHKLIEDRVLREALILKSKIKGLGIPQKIINLFEISKKSEAEKYCKNLQLDEFELFLLIHNCSQIDYIHEAKFREHIHDDVQIIDMGKELIQKGMYKEFGRKTDNLFKFRKQSHVHCFTHNNKWHIFYFNYSDTAEYKEGHWEGGSHIHYLSHLWEKGNKEEIFKAFDARKIRRSGFHIRFVPFQYPEGRGDSEIPISSVFGEQPMLSIINSQLPENPITTPIATAHIATRGIWTGTISIRRLI
jgi:hypothetical protein